MTDHVLLVGHRSVARVLLAYFKGLKREDVADLDVPLGMLYMLEPVSIYLQIPWTWPNTEYRSPMVLNSRPIVTRNRAIGSLKYTIINYGGRPLISRIKCLGRCILSKVWRRSKTAHTHRIWLFLYYYVMDSSFALDNHNIRRHYKDHFLIIILPAAFTPQFQVLHDLITASYRRVGSENVPLCLAFVDWGLLGAGRCFLLDVFCN